MRLAGAAVAEGDDVVAGDDIFAAREFENERLNAPAPHRTVEVTRLTIQASDDRGWFVQNSTKRLKVSHRIPDEKREHVPNKLSCPFHRVVRDFVIEALQETLEKPMDRRWYPHSQGEEPTGNQGCGRYW